MSDLPTREEAGYKDTEPDDRDWPTYMNRLARIAVAYADGVLLTEAEWDAKLPDNDLYIERYPEVGDGTHLDEDDEAYEAWQYIQEFIRQGYLVLVERGNP